MRPSALKPSGVSKKDTHSSKPIWVVEGYSALARARSAFAIARLVEGHHRCGNLGHPRHVERTPLPGLGVGHAERAEHVIGHGQDRHTQVGPNVAVQSREVVADQRVPAGVVHGEVALATDDVLTERPVETLDLLL